VHALKFCHALTSLISYADLRGSGHGLSLEGQQMLQKLMHETSERFSRGAKKKPIKGMPHARKQTMCCM
jgi:hypothetical protein